MSNGAVITILLVAFGAYLIGAWAENGDPAGSPTSAYERMQSEIG